MNALTTTESADQARLEAIINRGIANFIEVGNALREYNDKRLWRDCYSSFEECCSQKWGYKRSYAYDLMSSSEVAMQIPITLPNEAVAREVKRLPVEDRILTVELAQKTGELTPRRIKAAAQVVADLKATKGKVDLGHGNMTPITAAITKAEDEIELRYQQHKIDGAKRKAEKEGRDTFMYDLPCVITPDGNIHLSPEQYEKIMEASKQGRVTFSVTVHLDMQAMSEAAKTPEPEVQAPVVEVVAKQDAESLIINDEWKKLIDILNNGTGHIAVIGKAGVGKSTLLNYYVNQSDKRIVILAPTGRAARNVGGETIHSFFHFGIGALTDADIKPVKDSERAKYKLLDVIILDEVSMIRADLMDAIDRFMRINGNDKNKPFGGCRIVMFGDPFQLPPIVNTKSDDGKKEAAWLLKRYGVDVPFFFHAECWRDNQPQVYELTTVFRQKDPTFTEVLNAVRTGEQTVEHLKTLNERVNPNFKTPKDELRIILTTTYDIADRANAKMLNDLPGKSKVFTATITGDFKDYPTEVKLELKVGAAVMFVRNDPQGRWVNGTLGKVSKLDPLEVEVDGVSMPIDAVEWNSYGYIHDPETNKLTKSSKGTFEQIPLRHAAAIVIHKSQGMTYDKGIIDLGARGAFAEGMIYVAFSRFRSLDGIVLLKPIRPEDVMVNAEVQKFMRGEEITRTQPVQPGLFLPAKVQS